MGAVLVAGIIIILTIASGFGTIQRGCASGIYSLSSFLPCEGGQPKICQLYSPSGCNSERLQYYLDMPCSLRQVREDTNESWEEACTTHTSGRLVVCTCSRAGSMFPVPRLKALNGTPILC